MEWVNFIGLPPAFAAIFFWFENRARKLEYEKLSADFENYKKESEKRCQQHKEDSREILREIKDELKNIYGLIKDLSDKLYELKK